MIAKATGTDSRKSTSFHESGHAVFWELADITVESASALPFYDGCDGNGWTLGFVKREGGDGLMQLEGYIEGLSMGLRSHGVAMTRTNCKNAVLFYAMNPS